MKPVISIAFCFLLYGFPLLGHGDLDLRIEELNQQIAQHPDSAELYFKRGKLRYQHEEYQKAIDDINASLLKGYRHEFQSVYLAQSYYKSDRPKEALEHINTFLSEDSLNVVGLNIKGRILHANQSYEASALCFEAVIEHALKTLPENYLEAADSWLMSDHPSKYDKAIHILERGLSSLGAIVTLQNKMIDVYLQFGKNTEAIECQKKIIQKTRRKETPLYKLAELHLQSGNKKEARKAASEALMHLEKLPIRIQNNDAMQALKINIEKLLTITL